MIQEGFKEACLEFVKRLETDDLSHVILFGSVAKGEANRRSDIDMLVLGGEKTRKRASEVALDISKEFDVSIELVSEDSLEDLDTHFVKRVLVEGVVLYGAPLIKSSGLNLKPGSIISYSLKNLDHSEKMKVRRVLYGYSTKKEYKGKIYESSSKGLLEQVNGEKLGPGTILIPKEKLASVVETLERFGVEYERREIYLPAV